MDGDEYLIKNKKNTIVDAIDDIEKQNLYTNMLTKQSKDKLYCYMVEKIVELTNRVQELENDR